MKVILRETIESLGSVGDEVTVKKGFARNYLLPQNKAVLATAANREVIERERKKLEIRAAEDKERAEAVAKTFEGIVCTIAAKVSDEDRLYGSVGARDIEASLKAQGFDVDRKIIQLPESIKTLGDYTVSLQLHPQVRVKVAVQVVAEE